MHAFVDESLILSCASVSDPSLLDLLHRSGTVLLDTARPDVENTKSLLFANPVRVLRAERQEDVVPLLDAIDLAVHEGFHVAGFLAYEAAGAFLQVNLDHQGKLLGWFGVYDRPHVLTSEETEQLFAEVRDEGRIAGNPVFDYAREGYARKLAAIKHRIREGDVYQINFTGRFRFAYEGTPLGVYRSIRERQRVPFAAYIDTGEQYVLSFSPELFFRREGQRILTQPMKGTIRRGRTLAEDEQLADWLAKDAKSRAENLMIVDLLRNDFSMCCRNGSVHVPSLFATHRYETLIQMTSTVEGCLKPDIGYADLFQALFPCGSVTGAPKLRAMQRIRQLEEGPRGVYCGAVGYAAPDRHAVFNVAIRTLELQDGSGTMGVGSGVVADSDTDAEYEECLLKARFLTGTAQPEWDPSTRDFELIETMLWRGGGIPLLDLHLERLYGSAQYFGIPYQEQEILAHIQRETEALTGDNPHKVRLTLSRTGKVHITVSEVQVPSPGLRRAKISTKRVDFGNVFVYHKTTQRSLYEEEYRQAVSEGYDEVLFLNERGEMTEGSRTNLFVQRGGILFTPPVSSGLLAGVYRKHVLDTHPEAVERVLYLEDVYEADKCYVCNAVWGLVEIRFDPTAE